MTDLERIYESFIEEMNDYNELTTLDYIVKHIYPGLQEQLDTEYKDYVSMYDDDPEDMYEQDEWEDDVYAVENEDGLQQYIDDDQPLEIEVFRSDRNRIFKILLTFGGPNIWVELDENRTGVMWEGYWGSDEVIKHPSYLYQTIYNKYNLDYYE